MKQATIRSVCECQSQLEAVLDEHRYVLAGFAIGPDRVRERSPAHTIEAQHQRFDVAWLCPYCGRNTLRSFSADALSWIDADPPAPGSNFPVQPPAPLGPGPATGLSSAPKGLPGPPIRPPAANVPAGSATPPIPPAPAVPASKPPAPSSVPSLPNASTAVALKSLGTPSRPPSAPPPRPQSNPPPPPAGGSSDPQKST